MAAPKVVRVKAPADSPYVKGKGGHGKDNSTSD